MTDDTDQTDRDEPPADRPDADADPRDDDAAGRSDDSTTAADRAGDLDTDHRDDDRARSDAGRAVEARRSTGERGPDDRLQASDGGVADGRDAGDAIGDDVLTKVYWGGLAAAGFVALLALYGFYVNTTAAIRTFVASDYESLFLAGFNLVVLLGSGIVISLLARRLADRRPA